MSPNVERVVWIASIAQHNVSNQHLDLINVTSPKRSSIWLRRLVDTGIDESLRFSIQKAGGLVLDVWTESGGEAFDFDVKWHPRKITRASKNPRQIGIVVVCTVYPKFARHTVSASRCRRRSTTSSTVLRASFISPYRGRTA